jgi:hypothetical protein
MRWVLLVGFVVLLSASCGNDATCPEDNDIACGCDDVQRPAVNPGYYPRLVIDCVAAGRGYIPDGCITGRVFNVTPLEGYRVAVYASTEKGLMIQPWPGEAISIADDGTWWGQVAGADVFVAMLVPNGFGPEALVTSLPYKYDGPVLDFRGLLVLPEGWPREYQEAAIVPGVKIAGVSLGDSTAEAFRLLGSPSHVDGPEGGRYSLRWTSVGLDITGFCGMEPRPKKDEPITEDDLVIQLRALAPYPGTTLAGNGIGSSPVSFVGELGQPTKAYSDLEENLIHLWGKDGLRVVYRDSLATSIIVICPVE